MTTTSRSEPTTRTYESIIADARKRTLFPKPKPPDAPAAITNRDIYLWAKSRRRAALDFQAGLVQSIGA